mmetsp:Transcript_117727/g.375251  ORF Transcript_117727/g.375251 Transcript_117727/m.375251 type:complete len:258 (+) Transcript_117727:161-934(+)
MSMYERPAPGRFTTISSSALEPSSSKISFVDVLSFTLTTKSPARTASAGRLLFHWSNTLVGLMPITLSVALSVAPVDWPEGLTMLIAKVTGDTKASKSIRAPSNMKPFCAMSSLCNRPLLATKHSAMASAPSGPSSLAFMDKLLRCSFRPRTDTKARAVAGPKLLWLMSNSSSKHAAFAPPSRRLRTSNKSVTPASPKLHIANDKDFRLTIMDRPSQKSRPGPLGEQSLPLSTSSSNLSAKPPPPAFCWPSASPKLP